MKRLFDFKQRSDLVKRLTKPRRWWFRSKRVYLPDA